MVYLYIIKELAETALVIVLLLYFRCFPLPITKAEKKVCKFNSLDVQHSVLVPVRVRDAHNVETSAQPPNIVHEQTRTVNSKIHRNYQVECLGV